MQGLGVMLKMLGGNKETVEAYHASMGKQIAELALRDNRLLFRFADDSWLTLYDDGHSCCEDRYITCDDDIAAFVGAVLKEIELRDGPTDDPHGEPHERMFVIVTCDTGAFTLCTHNEHNGYYGGFAVELRHGQGDT